MARQIKIASGVLNIALHPHSPDIYASFILDAFALKKPVQLRGDRYGILSLVHRQRSDDNFISGVITTFTRLDADSSWFDTSKLSEANSAQLSQIQIPDNLFPNAASFYFSFDLSKHRLYFQTYSKGKVLSVNQAVTLFWGLSQDTAMLAKYPRPKITAVQSEAGLSTLFAIPRIKRVRITINRPNPDVFGDDFESAIERELENSNSRKVVFEFEAEAGESILPTPGIRKASEAALDNGRVEVSGRDENGRVEKSSDGFHRILQDKYDPEVQTEEQAFRGLIGRRAAHP